MRRDIYLFDILTILLKSFSPPNLQALFFLLVIYYSDERDETRKDKMFSNIFHLNAIKERIIVLF